MKKVFLSFFALALLIGGMLVAPTLAVADNVVTTIEQTEDDPTKAAGCGKAVFPLSLVDEDINGNNCPATGTEKGIGQIIFGLTFLAVGAEAMGADVFPLNAGIFSGL